MKKSCAIFTMLMALLFSAVSYAAFPVKKAAESNVTVVVSDTNHSESVELAAAAAPRGGKSQVAAVLLCWAVGIIGIHRFYLGYTWQGIVQILTLGGLGIWTLIDFIRIIIGDLQPKNGSYSSTF